MPITIGSQTDVPATGDPIVSPWYQDTATKLVHHFATSPPVTPGQPAPKARSPTRRTRTTCAIVDRGRRGLHRGFARRRGDYRQRAGSAVRRRTSPLPALSSVLRRVVIWSRVEARSCDAPNLALDRGRSALGRRQRLTCHVRRSSIGWHEQRSESITVVGTRRRLQHDIGPPA